MRYALLVLIIATSTSLWGQGLLRSRIIQTDTTRACTLTVRSFENWEDPVKHVFRVSTATYLLPGDYLVRYYMDTVWLHAEFVHISTKWTVIEKTIFPEPLPMHMITFIKPKKGQPGKYIELK